MRISRFISGMKRISKLKWKRGSDQNLNESVAEGTDQHSETF